MALLYSFNPCQAWALRKSALVFSWFSSRAWKTKKEMKSNCPQMIFFFSCMRKRLVRRTSLVASSLNRLLVVTYIYCTNSTDIRGRTFAADPDSSAGRSALFRLTSLQLSRASCHSCIFSLQAAVLRKQLRAVGSSFCCASSSSSSPLTSKYLQELKCLSKASTGIKRLLLHYVHFRFWE